MLHLQNTRASRRVASATSAYSAVRRPLIGVAIGAAVLASVTTGIVFAPTALGAVPTDAALVEASEAVQDGREVLVDAQALNVELAAAEVRPGTTVTAVDVDGLREHITTLSVAKDISGWQLTELTEGVAAEAAEVQIQAKALRNALTVAADIKISVDARIAAEEARVAAEAARLAEEEAARVAEALAVSNTPEGAKATARAMASERYGWGEGEFSCLVSLWTKESGWDYQAYNNDGGATGIPQSLPGDKMATAGSDWQTNASTQISWGLDYIKRAYGSPCSAWGHSQSVNWY